MHTEELNINLAFNTSLDSLMKNDPDSSVSKLIKDLISKFGQGNDLYLTLDNISFCLGIGIGTTPFLDEQYNTIGHFPYIKYYPDNPINEKPRTDELCDYLPLDKCYSYLAKELIYRMMRIPNIDEFIKSTTTHK